MNVVDDVLNKKSLYGQLKVLWKTSHTYFHQKIQESNNLFIDDTYQFYLFPHILKQIITGK